MRVNRGSISLRIRCATLALSALGIAIVSIVVASDKEQAISTYRRPNFRLYAAGREVFETRCIICHGPNGDGKGEMSASLPVKPRSFVQGIFKYRTTPPGKLPTDEDLRHTITGGISGTAMGMYSMLSDEEVTAVTEYVKSFSRRWRRSENYAEPIHFPNEPVWIADAHALKEHAIKGAAIYQTACIACHGATGDGKGPSADTMIDTWGFKIVPSDLRREHLRCGSEASDLYRVLTLGVDGTPMPAFDAFTPEQRWDLAAYVLELRSQFKASAEASHSPQKPLSRPRE